MVVGLNANSPRPNANDTFHPNGPLGSSAPLSFNWARFLFHTYFYNSVSSKNASLKQRGHSQLLSFESETKANRLQLKCVHFTKGVAQLPLMKPLGCVSRTRDYGQCLIWPSNFPSAVPCYCQAHYNQNPH